MTHPRFSPVASLAACLMALAAGCTAQGVPASDPGGGAPGGGPAAPKVDRLVLAVDPLTGEETNELRNMSSPSVWIYRSVYEYPIALDIKTGKLIPGLATAWKYGADGKTFEMKLRPNIPYHGGGKWGDFVAEDLAYMREDISRPDSLHGQTRYFRSAVASVEARTDTDVVFHLTKPDGQFVLAMSETQGGAEVRSKKQYDAEGNPVGIRGAHVGTGPYQYLSREQGTKAIIQRVETPHWTGVTPDFKEIEYRFVREPSTRLAALLTGEVHMASLPDDLQVQAVKQGKKALQGIFPGVRVFGQMLCCYFKEEPGQPQSGFVFPDSPLQDVRVRKALNKAVNKDEMNKAFFGGRGQNMIVNHFHPTRDGWDTGWERRWASEYGYDVEASKRLLAEAGYGPSRPLNLGVFTLAVTGVAGGPDIAEALGNYWNAVGVKVNLISIDAAEFARRGRNKEYDSHIQVFGTGSNQWTGLSVTNTSFATGGGVRTVKMEELITELTNTLEEDKRDGVWRKIGEELFSAHMGIQLFYLPAEAAVDPTVIGSWAFPGSLTGTWTHVHNIKAAR